MKKLKLKIGSSADTAFELKKTIELQLMHIHDLFSPAPKDMGMAIHESRQTYKKCRAILRLVRDSMGYASYYRENISLRDMQRELSQIRDADVQYHLFARLSDSYPEYSGKKWFTRMLEHARRTYDLELKHFLKSGKAESIARSARLKAAQIQQYKLQGDGFEIIEGGLFRIYKQGKELGKLVFSQEADASEIHAFRKKAKYLQYQLTYLRPISRELFKVMSASMGQLTESLGYYNDLHIACTRMEAYAEENKLKRKKLHGLLSGLGEEMQKAKSDSKQAYEMLYVEKPKHLTKRIGAYWKSHSLSLSK